MKIKHVLALMFVFAAAISLNVLADDGAKGPKIQFVESSYDFGTTVQGTQVKHIFKFKNVGTDTLKIEHVKTSCGCTAAWENSKVIPPQKEGQIEVAFNTGSVVGKASKTVFIISNDVESPKRSVVIHGLVEAKKTEEAKK